MSFFDFRKREKRPAAAALTYDPVKPEPPRRWMEATSPMHGSWVTLLIKSRLLRW